GAEVALGPIHHRGGERQRLDGHALPVHRGHALAQVVVARLERRGAGPLHHDRGAARIRPVDLAAGGRGGLLARAEEALGEEVRVNVDALGCRHGGDSTTASRRSGTSSAGPGGTLVGRGGTPRPTWWRVK